MSVQLIQQFWLFKLVNMVGNMMVSAICVSEPLLIRFVQHLMEAPTSGTLMTVLRDARLVNSQLDVHNVIIRPLWTRVASCVQLMEEILPPTDSATPRQEDYWRLSNI